MGLTFLRIHRGRLDNWMTIALSWLNRRIAEVFVGLFGATSFLLIGLVSIFFVIYILCLVVVFL